MKKAMKIAALIIAVIAVASGTLIYMDYFQGGTVKIYVHDTPVANATAVYITFTDVSLHGNASGWVNYSVGTQTVNILGLTATNASLLKSITLSAQHYTMMKLYIKKVSVLMASGSNVTFTMASSYAFINHPFTVQPHSTTDINIDFHLAQSLNMNAEMFTPSIGYTFS